MRYVIKHLTAKVSNLRDPNRASYSFVDIWGIGKGQTYPYLKALTDLNMADINYSGRVDMEDLSIFAAN